MSISSLVLHRELSCRYYRESRSALTFTQWVPEASTQNAAMLNAEIDTEGIERRSAFPVSSLDKFHLQLAGCADGKEKNVGCIVAG